MALSENDITSKDTTVSANKIYADAHRMLFTEGKSATQTVDQLTAQGVSEETANMIVQEIIAEAMQDTENASKSQAKRDMLVGTLWCVGGLIASFAKSVFSFGARLPLVPSNLSEAQSTLSDDALSLPPPIFAYFRKENRSSI